MQSVPQMEKMITDDTKLPLATVYLTFFDAA